MTRLPSDLSALAMAFLLVVGFTFSDDAVEFLLDITGQSQLGATDRQWLVLAVDLLLVLATAALKWQISRDRIDLKSFLRRLFSGWWAVGAGVISGSHLILVLTSEHRVGLTDVASIWINLAASAVFVAAMAMLLVSALTEGTNSRGWIVPLAVGTFAVQVASALWYPVINTDGGCSGEVSPTFFSDMNNINVVLMLTIAIELNYVRRNASEDDPGRRVAPVFTVLLMCIALALAFTMLVKADAGPPCGVAAVWHEYISFVVNVQALAIGLTTVVWLLLVSATDSA